MLLRAKKWFQEVLFHVYLVPEVPQDTLQGLV